MTPDQYADLKEYLEREFEEMMRHQSLLHEKLSEDLRAMAQRLGARVDGAAVRPEELEGRR